MDNKKIKQFGDTKKTDDHTKDKEDQKFAVDVGVKASKPSV